MDLKQESRLRTAKRSAFTRASTQLKTLLEQDTSTKKDIEVSYNILMKRTEELKDSDAKILKLLLEDEESDIDSEMEGTEKYLITFLEFQSEVSSILNSNTDRSNETNGSEHTRKFKLPKLEFRCFGGNIKEWLPFWSQFEKIDSDNQIATEDKFQYLIQATLEGSRAREVIDSFPPTKENYVKAVQSLKARFGREDLLVEVYVRELLKLILSVHQTKENLDLSRIYDKLETYLRALETLGVTSEKCASLLYPLVESCFPEDFLKAFHRNTTFAEQNEASDRLKKLLAFLKTEVEGEERITLAMKGFGLTQSKEDQPKKKPSIKPQRVNIPTASGFLNATLQDKKKSCAFCEGRHFSSECFSARKMNLEQKQKCLREKGCCYGCLKTGHQFKNCKAFLRCLICSKRHVPLMCGELGTRIGGTFENKVKNVTENEVIMTTINQNLKVFLQTLKVKLISDGQMKDVRVLLDTGSQKSYILKDTALEMGYVPEREETIIHSLFGGLNTEECKHNCFRIRLGSLYGQFRCNFEALDQATICSDILPVVKGPWLQELKNLKINLTDVGETPSPIQILIGADIIGKLLTGRREVLSCGLVAVETYLGWTVMGKVTQNDNIKSNMAIMITSLFVKEATISDLWSLDVIGITDPLIKKSKDEQELRAKILFQESVTINKEGRYEVSLPWTEDHLPLSSNKNLALKRLESSTKKLKSENLLLSYDEVFKQWLANGIIEEAPNEGAEQEHYLPHRPVIKENSTTKIRPVFDASAREKFSPSLNQCLECGPNLIECIPSILLRFRQFKYGVVADIEKAFLQISIKKEDRDYLRFFWWNFEIENQLKTFRHARVVFGVKCSPYLLGAVIDFHLKRCLENSSYDKDVIRKLSHSFYVDNVLASLHSKDELAHFIEESHAAMADGKFNLRDWQYTNEQNLDLHTTVLGLFWNPKQDTLSVNLDWLAHLNTEFITKRIMLSVAHKVFDPIGYTSPVMLCPKLVLQKTWKMKMSWDEEITGAMKEEFRHWLKYLHHLEEIDIPRWIGVALNNLENYTIHTFCDASQDAYATVVFLRVQSENSVNVFLLAAKSRIAPLKGGTIPRLELLAALIGVRLTKSVVEALNWNEVKCYFWSDSTVVLAWIKRDENWSVFVKNRVQEINRLSHPTSWNHVSGNENPADLPSRGCNAKQLIAVRWWEGPLWMRKPIEDWPCSYPDSQTSNDEIENEKITTTCLTSNAKTIQNRNAYFKYFSKYEQIVRLVGWILRFKHNCICSRETRIRGELTTHEFHKAEKRIIKMIQEEVFSGEEDKKLKALEAYTDENNIIRLKTKIIYRKDKEDFRKPMVLPSQHEVVERLILFHHLKNSHAGVQILLNILREQFWILDGRKTVKRVISKCTICRRYASKNLEAPAPPLPDNRIRDSAVFQITGVDMAGPLFLKKDLKAWVLIFTCAVYRAVHFELVTSISTEYFILAIRRFIARRGRCSIIYSDNGTNFVGTANLLKSLDWNRIVKHGTVNSIEWKFNPPTAAWWGGWWERLIRIMKDLLKRVLGRASLTYEEMTTILCECESVINSRPLTYLSENDAELVPITPSMFLQDIKEGNTTDLDAADHLSLNKRVKYRQTLLKDLRNRFRSEYLGSLIQRSNKKRNLRKIAVGEVVLVGADNSKRINWPLGRVIELLPGKDGMIRLVRLQTSNSKMLRPIQRIYPLEVASTKDLPSGLSRNFSEIDHPKRSDVIRDTKSRLQNTRSGRVVKIPNKLDL